ncbi:MAG: nuclear transport factor 2 family protein [Planctomycetota bacterium]
MREARLRAVGDRPARARWSLLGGLALAACQAPAPDPARPAAASAASDEAGHAHEVGFDRAPVDALLDRFHAAAARADFEAYFDCLDDSALFVGTDPHEDWTRAEFAAYVAPYFEAGTGWTYVPAQRRVDALGPDAAAFFERLDNAKYGRVRGSGVVARRQNRWQIVHYVLSFPVPNGVAPALLELVDSQAPPHD